MNISFLKLTELTSDIANKFNYWENDTQLIPFMRPVQNEADLQRQETITIDSVKQRLEYLHIYLIYQDGQLIGEMNYMVDPEHLFKKEAGTAWIGITIGEAEARGKGIGYTALQFLEEVIKQQGLQRIELGVFEFNTPAYKLYEKLGYTEIARIPDFTYWEGKMWADIRMEKYV